MTTDTTALQERLWDAIAEARDRGERTAHDVDSYDIVAAVLPIIAAEVQAAKAEALREAATSLWADPSAERGTTKAMYNAIYATWLEQRSNDIEQEVEHGNR